MTDAPPILNYARQESWYQRNRRWMHRNIFLLLLLAAAYGGYKTARYFFPILRENVRLLRLQENALAAQRHPGTLMNAVSQKKIIGGGSYDRFQTYQCRLHYRPPDEDDPPMSSAVRVVEDWGSFLGEIQKKNSDRWGSRFDSPVYLGKLETAGGKTFIVRIEIGGGAYTSYYTSKKEWAVSFDVALYRAGTFWSQPQFVNHLTVNLGSNIAAPPPAGWHNYDSPAMQAMLAAKDLRELRVYAGKNDEKQTDRATVAFEFNGVARKLTVMLVDSNEDVLMDLE